MPASAAQIEANRENAQLSTGPRTAEGKAASSQNATKSGLTSPTIFVRPEEQGEFDQFEANLFAELQPAGELQLHLFDLILHAAWNIRRCLQLEAVIQNEAMAQGLPDALLDDTLSRKLDRIYRYKKMHESTERRSIAALRQLQNEQVWRREMQEFLDDSVLVIAQPIVTALRQALKAQMRANQDRLHMQLEAIVNAPNLRTTNPPQNEAKSKPAA